MDDQLSPLDRFSLVLLRAPLRAPRWFGRGVYRHRRALLYVLIGLVAAHLLATVITGRMLDSEYARLRAEGVLLPMDKLVPHVPPGEANAADLYQKAFDTRRASREDEERLYGSPMTGGIQQAGSPSRQWLASARPILGANAASLAWLHRAARTRSCAFPVAWEEGFMAQLSHLAKLRSSARLLQADALLAAGEGRVDDALDDGADILRMADHVKMEPVVISQLVAYALQGIAVKSLQHTLSAGAPSPREARDLITQLAAIDNMGPSVMSMKGEVSLFDVPLLESAVRDGGRGLARTLVQDQSNEQEVRQARFLRLYTTFGRPIFNLDGRSLLLLKDAYFPFLTRPWPELPPGERSANGSQAGPHPEPRLPLTSMLMPVYTRFVWSRENKIASLGGAQIALALCLYKAEHGAYPASLTVLEAAGYKLPRDPFTGKPYQYLRGGAGFVVYSLGPDMKDDGGAPPVWDTTERLTGEAEKQRREHYDVPFRVTR
jgi:hypothetical protein